jgi:hypothetical protein
MTHYNLDILAAYATGKLAEETAREVEAHLSGCETCGETLDGLTVHTALLDRLHRLGPAPESTEATPPQLLDRLKQARRTAEADTDDLLRRGRLGQYRLRARLGAGGMGQVYKAVHLVMKREVALKVLPSRLAAVPTSLERFHREVEVLARLDHRNIVRAYDAGLDDGVPYLVMEYVAGTDLHRHVYEHGPLPVEAACDYIRQAAAALQHAHAHHYVHRGIKPSNLLLDAGRHVVKISDLGLARAEQIALGESTVGELTSEGIAMGTPDLLAPEQWEDARRADIRADLYSLGCTFYFLLTAQPPYPGGAYREKMARHCRGGAVPVEQLRPETPAAVAAVVRKLMAPDPRQRYQTPAELIDALDGTAVPAPAPKRPPALPRRRLPLPYMAAALAIGAAALALVLVLGGAFVLFALLGHRGMAPDAGEPLAPDGGPVGQQQADKTQPVPRPAVAIVAGEPQLVKEFKGHTGEVTWVAFAPDGTSFASASFDQTVRLWKPAEDEPIAKLRHKGQVMCVTYSPDGKTLATCTDGEGAVRLWDVATETETLLGTHHDMKLLRCVSFRSDGRLLASGSMAVQAKESVKLWDVPGKQAIGSLGPAWDRSYAGVYAAVFCPGTKLLAVAHHAAPNPAGVRLWDTETNQELDFLAGLSVALAFSPDGRRLAAAEGPDVTIWAVDPEKKRAVPDRKLQFKPAKLGPALACCAAFAPDDRTLAVAYRDGTVVLWNTQSSEQLTAFTAHAEVKSAIAYFRECSVAFAPDGQTLLTGGFDHAVKLWKLPTVPQK